VDALIEFAETKVVPAGQVIRGYVSWLPWRAGASKSLACRPQVDLGEPTCEEGVGPARRDETSHVLKMVPRISAAAGAAPARWPRQLHNPLRNRAAFQMSRPNIPHRRV